jgi:glycerol-3-phosphate dehydrogenase
MHSAAAVARRVPGIRTDGLLGGGSYLDGATDDARLTLAVALTAMEHGALALSRMEVTAVENGASGARVSARDLLSGDERTLDARAVVLAGGPFTDALRGTAGLAGRWIQPTRGTHVIVPRERLPTRPRSPTSRPKPAAVWPMPASPWGTRRCCCAG